MSQAEFPPANPASLRLHERIQTWLRKCRHTSGNQATDALPPSKPPRLRQIRPDRRGPWTRVRSSAPVAR
jgi:hypothetical protein